MVRLWLDPVWLDHDPGVTHPEAPWRLRSVTERLAGLGREPWLEVSPAARVATRAELCLGHDADYVDRLLALDGTSFAIDEETLGSPGTIRAARLAVGAVLDMVDHLLAGGGPGFVAARPPGHHATRRQGMGYCFFNQIAIGARYAAARGARVLVLDWDAHWGNGTADILAGTDARLVCTHEWDLFPEGGDLSDHAGGSALHLPLMEGATEDDALRLIAELLCPLASARSALGSGFPSSKRLSGGPSVRLVPALEPATLVLVSAGYDAHVDDPMSHLAFTTVGYGRLTSAAMELGQGRVGLVLEGGYDVASLGACVDATLRALARPQATWRPESWAPWVDALIARVRTEHPWWTAA